MLRKQARSVTIHGCLGHERRRHVLHFLKNEERPQTLADVAEYVAGRESETEGRETDEEIVKDTYLSLYHCDIPKLEEGNLVQYDQEKDTVALTEYPKDFINEEALLND